MKITTLLTEVKLTTVEPLHSGHSPKRTALLMATITEPLFSQLPYKLSLFDIK